MIFGFLLAVAFNPFIYAAATVPRWALLSVALPLLLWQQSPSYFTPLHLIGCLLVSWCALSLAWTANGYDGLGELGQLALIAQAFVLGNRLGSMREIFKGLAIGLIVSSLLVATPLYQFMIGPVSVEHEGLLGNRNMLSEAAVLTLLGCIGYRLWWFIPGILPSIFVWPQERASMLALIVAAGCWLWSYSKWLTVACGAAVIGAGLSYAFFGDRISSTSQLIQIWSDTSKGLTFWGHGIGSFLTLFPFLTSTIDIVVSRPEHAHNDFLEIIFDYGFIGAFLYASFTVVAIGVADRIYRPILAAFLVIGCFSFPWHVPVTAFIGACVIGCIAGRGFDLRSFNDVWRNRVFSWIGLFQERGRCHQTYASGGTL